MSSKKYVTTQQYEPLKVPSGWKDDEIRLVQRLTELFDDIYKRYGRLGLDDISTAFSEALDLIRTNVSTAQETAEEAMEEAVHANENAGNASAAAQEVKNNLLPVGAVYVSVSNTSPKAYGSWSVIGTGTVGSKTLYYWERKE